MSSPTVTFHAPDADPDLLALSDANEIAPCGPIADDEFLEDVVFQEGWIRNDEMDESATLGDGVWNDSCRPRNATVEFGKGISKAWSQAKVEIKSFQEMLLKATGTINPKIDDVFDIVFGDNSPVCQLFVEQQIVKTPAEFKHFLATFFLSSAHQNSAKDMFNPKSRIVTDDLMSEKEYGQVWQFIAKSNLSKRDTRTRKTEPFWLKFERIINELGKKLFIDHLPDDQVHQMTIDDDKVHIQTRKNTAELKIVRHVRDNVNGHTCHTMVLSFSQMPVQLAWEREDGDTTQEPFI